MREPPHQDRGRAMTAPYDHEEFKRRLAEDPASGGFPPDFADYPPEERRKWIADNTAAILADSDALVDRDGLDEDFLDIGRDWNDPEFLAGAKSAKPNGMGSMASRSTDMGSIMRRRGRLGANASRRRAPISYTVDGNLPSGYLYGLTAKQGSGKTAFMIAASLAVVLGNETILGCEVEKGRVAYVTIENPTDFKMKLAVNCYVHNISYAEIEHRLAIIDGRDTPEQIYEGLKRDAEENGPFQLVCFDTFQAGFAAANAGAFNDNEATLAYIIRLRPLTTLPGQPSVLVAFHPTKHASEADLIPYGGGSTYNEVDGNLTLWKEGQIKLYHNRLRGPEFDPTFFRIENAFLHGHRRQEGAPNLLAGHAADNGIGRRSQKAGGGKYQCRALRGNSVEPQGNGRRLGRGAQADPSSCL